METIEVDIATATTEQLLTVVIGRLDQLNTRLNTLETRMSALTESVDALKGAVDGVAQRLMAQVETLEGALATALSDDAADDAAIAQATQEATEAAAAIRVEADRLNALGAEPSTPVDEAAPQAEVVPDVEVVSEPSTDVAPE